ncbi:MAG TPA: S1C family serine protease [Xanthobacteraceae bacterium]|jgi:S1-C subfamily serine protease
MRQRKTCFERARWSKFIAIAVFAFAASTARAEPAATLDELIGAVVKIKTQINPEGTTVRRLGRERDGSGILIDAGGLVLTIGYLMVEAYAAEIITNDGHTVPATVVGYDNDTGFGLLRAIEPLRAKPLPLGRAADVKVHDVAVVASGGGPNMVSAVTIVSKREFAADWEYLLDEALFTAPPHPEWSGAALISHEGKLVGVGSLMVGDAAGNKDGTPGNMFVPIDALLPILGDLIADGRPTGPGHPWLGMNTEETRGQLVVSRTTRGGPAEKAGINRGDVIVTVNGEAPKGLADFYHKMWSKGNAGDVVAIELLHRHSLEKLEIKSMSRLDHLKLKSSF